MLGRRYRVMGVVQGVGFRWWSVREAHGLGLVGRVWNARDGTVGIDAWGDGPALDAFRSKLEDGPPAARVIHVFDEGAPEGLPPAEFLIERERR